MEQNLIKIDPKEFGFDEKQAIEILKNLPQLLSEREILIQQFDEIIKMDINDPLTAKQAGELRKLIKDNRTKGIEPWHKTGKEYFLRGGQFYDANKRRECEINERMETILFEIENHQAIIEKERIEKLKQERIKILSQYIDNPESYPVAQMSEEAFNNLIEVQKLIVKQRADEAKKAEKERIEKELRDAKERERIRLENEQLKKENEAKELQLQKEREQARQEQIRLENIQKEKDRLAQIERDKIEAENRRIQKELQDKKDAEIKEQNRLAEIEKQKQIELEKAQFAPDKTKLTAWIDGLFLPELRLSSPKSVEVAQNIDAKFQAFQKWAKEQIETI